MFLLIIIDDVFMTVIISDVDIARIEENALFNPQSYPQAGSVFSLDN